MSVLLLVLASAWLVFVVLHRLLSGRYWLWLLPDLLPPVSYLGVPLVLAAISVPTAQHWTTGVALAAIAAGIGHSGLNLRGIGRAADPPPGAVSLLSWNTQYWDQGNPNLYDFLKAKNADVYVLQERLHGSHYDPRPAPDLPRLHEEFPGYHIATAGELVTLSRFPIVGTQRIDPPAGTRWTDEYHATKALRTDLRLGADVLSVYNVHIPVQYLGTDNVLTREFYAQLRDRNKTRKAQFQSLYADLTANQNMVLVTGDFNSTGAMGDLAWLFRNLNSANHAARRLWPSSWPAHGLSLWQLDWTFTRGLRVHRYEFCDPQGISDHRTQELLVLPEEASHDRTQTPAEVSTRANQ
jgi:endonuclease/exonuclease/phosphatase (EEP) superfamily protein YafD